MRKQLALSVCHPLLPTQKQEPLDKSSSLKLGTQFRNPTISPAISTRGSKILLSISKFRATIFRLLVASCEQRQWAEP